MLTEEDKAFFMELHGTLEAKFDIMLAKFDNMQQQQQQDDRDQQDQGVQVQQLAQMVQGGGAQDWESINQIMQMEMVERGGQQLEMKQQSWEDSKDKLKAIVVDLAYLEHAGTTTRLHVLAGKIESCEENTSLKYSYSSMRVG
jgi:hypothetical protein